MQYSINSIKAVNDSPKCPLFFLFFSSLPFFLVVASRMALLLSWQWQQWKLPYLLFSIFLSFFFFTSALYERTGFYGRCEAELVVSGQAKPRGDRYMCFIYFFAYLSGRQPLQSNLVCLLDFNVPPLHRTQNSAVARVPYHFFIRCIRIIRRKPQQPSIETKICISHSQVDWFYFLSRPRGSKLQVQIWLILETLKTLLID